jgi:hypothetical protein
MLVFLAAALPTHLTQTLPRCWVNFSFVDHELLAGLWNDEEDVVVMITLV